MDISESRLVRMEENAKRLRMDIQVVQQDGTQYNQDLVCLISFFWMRHVLVWV